MAAIEQVVEKVVSQVLENHAAQMRDEMVRRVLEEIRPHLGTGDASASTGSSASDLLEAISSIHAGSTQREILKGLLEGTAKYAGRSALFVVKGGAATGWQGRGFSNNDGVKECQLDVNNGPASNALHSRTASSGACGEMGDGFVSQLGSPKDDRVIVLPLLLKDKVAALVYVDGGSDGVLDTAALEVLVLSTSAWLEVASLRKVSAQPTSDAPSVDRSQAAPTASAAAPAFSDPFAGHAPKHAMAAAAPASSAPAGGLSVETPAEAPAPPADPFAGMSPEDADLHRKAQRFGRLLVDEIKLYNQVKVAEGRKNKDLYDRLKEDIEKSRGTYQKRYGNTAAASVDYFSQELIRSLAEDDVSFMGPNFRR